MILHMSLYDALDLGKPRASGDDPMRRISSIVVPS